MNYMARREPLREVGSFTILCVRLALDLEDPDWLSPGLSPAGQGFAPVTHGHLGVTASSLPGPQASAGLAWAPRLEGSSTHPTPGVAEKPSLKCQGGLAFLGGSCRTPGDLDHSLGTPGGCLCPFKKSLFAHPTPTLQAGVLALINPLPGGAFWTKRDLQFHALL